jgi:3-hydroxyisobutyrate dehydrogenase-like beta-hydroxyacid dehydrogenase
MTQEEAATRLGYVGLGNMSAALARRLLRKDKMRITPSSACTSASRKWNSRRNDSPGANAAATRRNRKDDMLHA